jgi:drug/metabolite transporter (DMT)-like permease
MSVAAFAGLILCNLVWSVHPTLGKVVLEHFTPAQTALLRYGSAFAAYVLVAGALKVRARLSVRPSVPLFFLPRTRREAWWLFLAGFMPFCYAPALGMTGLRDTDATHGALIIAMEPFITLFMARVFLGDRLRHSHFFAFAAAVLGFAMLSGLRFDRSTVGNLVLLVSLVGEGAYSVGMRKLHGRHAPATIFGTALAFGVAGLAIVALLAPATTPPSGSTSSAIPLWLALLWLGPLGTTLGYWVWMRVLERASIATMTLTLFVQPVCGAVWGWVFLGDRMSATQTVGAVMILAALSIQAYIDLQPQSDERPKILKK